MNQKILFHHATRQDNISVAYCRLVWEISLVTYESGSWSVDHCHFSLVSEGSLEMGKVDCSLIRRERAETFHRSLYVEELLHHLHPDSSFDLGELKV